MDGAVEPGQASKALPAVPDLEPLDEDDLLPVLLGSAAAVPSSPPAEWFTEPADVHEQVVVTAEGRIYGRLFSEGQCHIGSPPGVCVGGRDPQIRPSENDYAWYRLSRGVTCDDGSHPRTGALVLAPDHAPGHGLSAPAASRYYSDVGLAVADVTVGDGRDEHGWYVWYSGALRPGLSDVDLRTLACSQVSGDWRPVDGRLELVSIMAVNTPGFPQVHVAASAEEIEAVVLRAPGPTLAERGHVEPVAACSCASRPDPSAARLALIERQLAEVLALLAPQREAIIAALEADLRG
jgi:hypothetical protein